VIENRLLNNGDGLYFINEDGVADGVQINIIVNDIVVPNTFKNITVGTVIYRNSDAEFNRIVEKENSAVRKNRRSFYETADGFLACD
jgi:putative protease